MNTGKRIVSVLLLAASVAAAQTQSSTGQKKEKPKTEEQLRLDRVTEQMLQMERQMTDLQQQLKEAKDEAAAAQARADQAAKATEEVKGGAGQNAQAVTALQGSVDDLKTSSSAAVQKLQDDQKKIQDEQKQTKEAIEHPDILHYKGITLSPAGSFLAGETVDRNHATGGDIPTPWTSIPFSSANLAQTSEFFGSGRQSRIALLAEGKTAAVAYRGYYEADFLAAGTNSNNNQSNSYALRQRQVWAQLETQSGWALSVGQMWSLATEYKNGLTLRTEATPLSQQLDEVHPTQLRREDGSHSLAGQTEAQQKGSNSPSYFDLPDVVPGGSPTEPCRERTSRRQHGYRTRSRQGIRCPGRLRLHHRKASSRTGQGGRDDWLERYWHPRRLCVAE